MRPSSFIVGIAAATIFVSSALAEEHPCVQPQDPFVVALCSDPELRATADQQREEMMALWNRLSPQEQGKFRNDQLAWRDITARRCRVDHLLLAPLSAETKNCLRQAEARRLEFLRHYGQTDTPTALHPNALPQVTSPASIAVTDEQGATAYQDGLHDRAAWEEWFNGLQGDYKTGAFFWSSQRSLPKPGSCKQMNDDSYAGCTAAKTRLSASDTRRKTEPDYKAGWNALNPRDLTTSAAAPSAPQPSAPVAASTPAVTLIPAAPAPQAPIPSVRWYLGHLGADSCVPLTDVGHSMERVYYGAGSMQAPEDMAAHFHSIGGHTQWVDAGAMAQYSRIFHATGPGLDTYVVMFNDKDVCQLAMSTIEK
jgi:hypothetical protein